MVPSGSGHPTAVGMGQRCCSQGEGTKEEVRPQGQDAVVPCFWEAMCELVPGGAS